MAKQPYIQFYLGDYIKDTRVLPLNVKGGWVDLILAMWDNSPKGELTGTIEDFSRIMNCSKDEANLVIQTLKQKKTFDYEDLPDGHLKIISRKQKKMQKLSEIRKNVGKTGGNPVLVKQNGISVLNQKDKLNAEYEYEYKDEDKDRGVGKGWNTTPGEKEMDLALDEVKGGAVVQMFSFSQNHNLTKDELSLLWSIFKKQNFTGSKFYQDKNAVYSHFINWSKTQKVNGQQSSTSKSNGTNYKTAGQSVYADRLKQQLIKLNGG